jgi:hypothetical protein
MKLHGVLAQRLSAADQTPEEEFRMILPDTSEGHTQHDPHRPATPGLHPGQTANRMEFKAEGDVEATIDPFARRPAGIFAPPCALPVVRCYLALDLLYYCRLGCGPRHSALRESRASVNGVRGGGEKNWLTMSSCIF